MRPGTILSVDLSGYIFIFSTPLMSPPWFMTLAGRLLFLERPDATVYLGQ